MYNDYERHKRQFVDIGPCATYDDVYNTVDLLSIGSTGIGFDVTNPIKSLLPTHPCANNYVKCYCFNYVELYKGNPYSGYLLFSGSCRTYSV